MRKIYITGLIFTLFTSWIVLSSSSGGRASAANTGNTGAPGETSTCASCHSGGSYGTVTLSIQAFDLGTTTVAPSYVGGTQYDMRVTVNHTAGSPAAHGFQLVALKQTGNTPIAGYSNLGSNVKQKALSSGRTYLEHNGVAASNQFNFRWTAPASGSGNITFYAAGNCVNATGSDNGDKAGNSSFTFTEAVAALSVSGTTTNVNCNSASTGSITLTPAGGTPAYTYKWSDGPTTKDRANIPAGSYTVTVTDAASATASASFTITQPAALAASNTATTILCSGGSGTVTVSASGGTAPYTGTGGFSRTAGTYSFTVTDAKGCTATTSVTLSQPAQLLASAPNDTIACTGDSAVVLITASAGTPPYSGTGNVTIKAPGSYNYTVTDANGCTAVATSNITTLTDLQLQANTTDALCYGACNGAIDITVSGGQAPFTNLWVSGETTEDLSNLCRGTYEHIVTDNNGCSATLSVVVGEPDSLFVSDSTITNTVNNTGAVDITVSGGTVPYAYNWSNGDTTQDIGSLTPGLYTVTITDANSCSFSLSATVAALPNALADLQLNNVSLYPNPANNILTLSFNVGVGHALIEVLDVTGNVVLKQQVQANNVKAAIDVAHLPASLYLVKLTAANGVVVKQFIKQ